MEKLEVVFSRGRLDCFNFSRLAKMEYIGRFSSFEAISPSAILKSAQLGPSRFSSGVAADRRVIIVVCLSSLRPPACVACFAGWKTRVSHWKWASGAGRLAWSSKLLLRTHVQAMPFSRHGMVQPCCLRMSAAHWWPQHRHLAVTDMISSLVKFCSLATSMHPSGP